MKILGQNTLLHIRLKNVMCFMVLLTNSMLTIMGASQIENVQAKAHCYMILYEIQKILTRLTQYVLRFIERFFKLLNTRKNKNDTKNNKKKSCFFTQWKTLPRYLVVTFGYMVHKMVCQQTLPN